MATAEEYSQGLLDKEPVQAEATTYEADKRTVDQATDTVQGQLNTVLDEDNAYIQRAKHAGESYAQKRGLLNSSIAAGASQAAAIDAALPIAQQDADTSFRQGLENQAAENTARNASAQLETQVSQSNASEDTARIGQAISSETNRFSELEATNRQEIIATTEIQTTDAKLAAEKFLQNQQIAQEDRETFSTAYNEITRQNDVELTKLATDPELSEVDKNRLIAAQNGRYVANVQLLADLYEFPLTMDESVGLVGTDVANIDDYNAERAEEAARTEAQRAGRPFSFNRQADDGPYQQVYKFDEASNTYVIDAVATEANRREYEQQQQQEYGSCFTGETRVVTHLGQTLRIDEIRPGDRLVGADGHINAVFGIEKVPVAGRPLLEMKGLTGQRIRFTGEHPILLQGYEFGAFDKAAMDRSIQMNLEGVSRPIVRTADGCYEMQRNPKFPLQIRQIEEGDMTCTILVDTFHPLKIKECHEVEEWVYTLAMDGSRTFNVDGVIVSGLADGGWNFEENYDMDPGHECYRKIEENAA